MSDSTRLPPAAGRQNLLWERTIARLDQHERWVTHARAALRDRRQELAALGEEPVGPAAPVLAAIFSTGAIALSFTLPLHDIVFARVLALPEQALLAAFAAACLISGVTTTTALGGAGLVLRERAPRLGAGALAAVLLAAALLLLRLAGTNEVAQWMLAAGFSVLELACVLLLETYAHRLAEANLEHRHDREVWLAAQAQIEIARDEVAIAERELQSCDRAVRGLAVDQRHQPTRPTPPRERQTPKGDDGVGAPLLSPSERSETDSVRRVLLDEG